jgi:teichuronic acid biosynthesis glycosyltransferase TuaG
MAGYEGNEAVRFAKNEKNLGAAATRNRGVTLARGKYVAFLDADDYWTEDKLVRQLALIEQTGCVLCCTARELMTPEGELTGKVIPVKEKISYRELLKHNSINCSSVLILTDVAREFPMHHDDSHEDYIMWLEVLRKYETACGINEPMLKYRLSNSGKSGNKLHSAKMTFMVYRYMGFGVVKSMVCFCSYAFHGVKKYFFH